MDEEQRNILRDFGIDPDRPIESRLGAASASSKTEAPVPQQPGREGATISLGAGRNIGISNNRITGYRPAIHAGAVDGLDIRGNRITELQPPAPKRPWRKFLLTVLAGTLAGTLATLAAALVLGWI